MCGKQRSKGECKCRYTFPNGIWSTFVFWKQIVQAFIVWLYIAVFKGISIEQGGGGCYIFFSESKYLFTSGAQQNVFFAKNYGDSICFLQNIFTFKCRNTNIFLRHKVLTEYFFCPFQRQNFFNQIWRQKNHRTPPPPRPFKLNGCSLNNYRELCNHRCILLEDGVSKWHKK